jgi:hypothetical protein
MPTLPIRVVSRSFGPPSGVIGLAHVRDEQEPLSDVTEKCLTSSLSTKPWLRVSKAWRRSWGCSEARESEHGAQCSSRGKRLLTEM